MGEDEGELIGLRRTRQSSNAMGEEEGGRTGVEKYWALRWYGRYSESTKSNTQKHENSPIFGWQLGYEKETARAQANKEHAHEKQIS